MRRAAIASAAIAPALPTIAAGATVSITGGRLVFVAASGEVNHVTVLRGTEAIRVTDSGAPIAAGARCSQVTPNEAACDLNAFPFQIMLGDLDDSAVVYTATDSRLFGGEGRDHLDGGEGSDELNGGPGDDVLRGGVGEDRFSGGPGADSISGGRGSLDVVFGGDPGEAENGLFVAGCEISWRGDDAFDLVSYYGRPGPVSVTLDGLANDGVPGEGDNIIDMEWVLGGRGDDVFVGDDHVNVLTGFGGNDRLVGGGSADLLLGGTGDDVADLGRGNDCAAGDRGRDLLRGGDGADLLLGGSDPDRAFGGAGSDTFRLTDGGPDFAHGGPGRDTAYAEARLDHLRSVERAIRGPRRFDPPFHGERRTPLGY